MEERYAYVVFGERVRERRKELGWSQETLAEKAGLDRTHIGRCELGKQNATLKTIYALAAALGVEATDLLPPMSEVTRER
ncbi:XRE family transcriptional regulator [bacterium]|nr:XRE family transcriptional regulator [bacterium]